jgi:hypothetical protein
LREAIQQIASRILFGSSWFAFVVLGLLGGRRRRIGQVAFSQDLLKATQ